MISFHDKQEVKDFYLARVRAHAAADEIIHGIYWQNGKGCAVGCTVHSSRHEDYEKELGIPRILAKLEDNIFESLSNGRSKLWPEQFLNAPRVGADLYLVWPKFAIWLLVDPEFGVIQFNRSTNGKKAIQDVADAYQSIVDGKNQERNWLQLKNAAADAADAADDADDAYAAADAARQKFRNAQADKLIELMSQA